MIDTCILTTIDIHMFFLVLVETLLVQVKLHVADICIRCARVMYFYRYVVL